MTTTATFTTDELLQRPWLPVERVGCEQHAVRSERGVEVISYNACAGVLRDTRYTTGLIELFDVAGVTDDTIRELVAQSVNSVEGADHARLRGALGSFFSPARVAAMREEVRAWIDQAMADIGTRTEVELVSELIARVPGMLFARLLGIDPQDNREFISHISEEAVRVFEMDSTTTAQVTAAWNSMTVWVDDLVGRHRPASPADNLLDHLLAQQALGRLSATDVQVCLVTVLAASTDTTQILAGSMFCAFAESPEQWQRLRQEPALVSSAVMEAARYRPGDAWIFRVATVDGEIEGVPVAAGDHVFALIGAAHRDPSVFADPDRFDIGRSGERTPLNWGVGRHFCLGRMFAVMELEEMLAAASRRWAAIEHLDPAAAEAAPYLSIQASLPVRVRPAV